MQKLTRPQVFPCPFCGNMPDCETWEDEDGNTEYAYACNHQDCGIAVSTYPEKEEHKARDAWNARHDAVSMNSMYLVAYASAVQLIFAELEKLPKRMFVGARARQDVIYGPFYTPADLGVVRRKLEQAERIIGLVSNNSKH